MQRITDWSRYHDFLAIARAGRISAAAREMGVSQPTLSRRLAQLEADLGVRLVYRIPAGLSLTPAGERIHDALLSVQDTIEAAENEVVSGDVALRGSVRVTVTETLGVVWLAPLIREFNEAYPQIRIELVIDNAAVNLLAREAHIAIRLMRPVQGDLIARSPGAFEIGLYCSDGYARRYGAPQTPDEAKHHRAVGLLATTPTAQLTARYFPPEAHALQANSMLAIASAVTSGLGIGPVIDAHAAFDPALRRCLPEARLEKDVWLVAAPELRESARVKAVYDFLGDQVAAVLARIAR